MAAALQGVTLRKAGGGGGGGAPAPKAPPPVDPHNALMAAIAKRGKIE